jgi:hypothetical protein
MSQGKRRSRVRRLALLAAVAALAVVTAVATIARGAPSGGGAQLSTAAPDWNAAGVVQNGSATSTGVAILLLCADKAISPGSIGPATIGAIRLVGYGGNGGGTPSSPATQSLTLSSLTGTTAAISANPDCITVTIPAAQSPDGFGVDLNGFSVVTIAAGAVTDASSRGSVQASLALSPSAAEITLQIGQTTGPKLIFVAAPSGSVTQLVYTFNRPLDPGFGTAPSYGYVQSDGTVITGTAMSISGSSVTVTFPVVVNAVSFFVRPNANRTQTQDVPDPGDAAGGAIANAPTIRSVAPVPGFPGAFDVSYDQAVTVADPSKFVALLEDNAGVPVTAGNVSRPGPTNVVRITFGAPVTQYASKIVRIEEIGGAVVQQSVLAAPSVPGAGDVRTPPMSYGFTDGPDLTGVAVDASAATATFCFDSNYGSLFSGVNPAAFHLVNADGTLSAAPTAAAVTGANTVTAQFGPSQIATAVGGTLLGLGVEDNQGIGNISPMTSGLGGNTAACAGTSTTTSATTTVTRTVTQTVTRTITQTQTINSAPCISSRCATGLSLIFTRLRGGNDKVVGRVTGSHGYCGGFVTVSVLKNGSQIGAKTTGVDSSCDYGLTIHVGNRAGKQIRGRFGGNRFLLPDIGPAFNA